MLRLRTREQREDFGEPVVTETPVPHEETFKPDPPLPIYAVEETPEPTPLLVEPMPSSSESSDVLELEEHEPAFVTAQEDEAVVPEPLATEPKKIESPVASEAVEQEEPVEAPAVVPAPSVPPSSFQPADVVLALREATAKVSTAIERAAEWLREKEDEILRQENSVAEPTLAPQPVQVNSLEAHKPEEPMSGRVEEISPSAPEPKNWPEETWAGPEIPALQQEMAWREPGNVAARLHSESRPIPASLPRSSDVPIISRTTPKSRSPRIPIWKQIDWSHEFTPKRVAVIGALVMAALLAVGMSMARRPASTMLPEQSRRLEPGGVTVTAHPRPTPAQPAHHTTQQTQAPAAPPSTRHRAPSYDDDPDVVTHYYTHGKPSPVHQSTVAGVRHYSDIE